MTYSLSPLSCSLPRSTAFVLALSLSALHGCGTQIDEFDESAPFADVSCDLDAGTAPAAADASPPNLPDASPVSPPPSENVFVKSVAATGRCRVTLDPSGTGAVLLENFAVSVGKNESLDSASCSLFFDIGVPQGLSYVVTGVRAQGTAKLEEGVTASIRSSYHFLGGPDLGEKVAVLRGPAYLTSLLDTAYPANAGSFLPCGSIRELRVDLSLNMRGESSAAGTISLDQLSPLTFEVRPCTPAH